MNGSERQRIDKWLFFARVVKSRSLAAKLASAGRVRVNRDKIDQPSHPVKPGDVLTISLDRGVLVYKILAAGIRRGPAPEARLLYQDLTPRQATADTGSGRVPGSGRPSKRERRALDRFTREP